METYAVLVEVGALFGRISECIRRRLFSAASCSSEYACYLGAGLAAQQRLWSPLQSSIFSCSGWPPRWSICRSASVRPATPSRKRLQLLCSSLLSLRSLPLSFGGDSLLPKLKNCSSL